MFTFVLSEEMVTKIAQILGEVPFKIANPILTEMQKQIDAQRQPTPPTLPLGNGKDEANVEPIRP